MGRAELVKQILVTAKNEVGMFAQVVTPIAEANANLRALCAWGMQETAFFAILTDNNEKAKKALDAKGFKYTEQHVVCVGLADRIGAAADIAKIIKDARVNLEYVYGSTCGCEETSALLVLVSKEYDKLLAAING